MDSSEPEATNSASDSWESFSLHGWSAVPASMSTSSVYCDMIFSMAKTLLEENMWKRSMTREIWKRKLAWSEGQEVWLILFGGLTCFFGDQIPYGWMQSPFSKANITHRQLEFESHVWDNEEMFELIRFRDIHFKFWKMLDISRKGAENRRCHRACSLYRQTLTNENRYRSSQKGKWPADSHAFEAGELLHKYTYMHGNTS